MAVTPVATSITSLIPTNFDAVRSRFAGPTTPAEHVAYQPWTDTTLLQNMVRNAADSADVYEAPFPNGFESAGLKMVAMSLGALAAKNVRLMSIPKATVLAVVLYPSATTVGSTGAIEWRFMLRNVTAGLNLFSAVPGTGTVVGGVGGGELAIDAAKVFTPNQNANTTRYDSMRLEITVAGAPTAVADCLATLFFQLRG